LLIKMCYKKVTVNAMVCWSLCVASVKKNIYISVCACVVRSIESFC